MPKFNLGWLKDKNGAKFAPKTFLSQILQNDGSLFQDRVKNIEDNISNHEERITNNENNITNHQKRYGNTEFCLTDDAINCDYVVKIHNGNMIFFKKCVGIKVKSTVPDLSVFNGGKFNSGDIVVTAICQDGSEREIANYNYTKPITSSPVEITYEELGETFTTSIDVNIMSVEESLIDFNYTTNNDGTYTITGWKGTLNGEPSSRMIVPNSSKVIF